MRTPREPQAIELAEASFADLRAAQRFALETGDLDTAFGLIVSAHEFAMRAMRYELFAWADAACRAEGALGHPLAPVLTGVRAYGAWVRGEFELAVALAHETRALEDALGVEPSGLAERALGNTLLVLNDDDGALRASIRQVELAEASGVASRIVHACYMGAVGHERERRSRRRRDVHRPRPRARRRDRQPDRPRLGRGRGRLREPQRRGRAGGLPQGGASSHEGRATGG